MVVKKRQSINEAESLKVGDVVSVVGQRKPSVVLGVYPDAHAVKVTTVGNVDVDDVKKLSKSEVLSSIKRNLLLDLDVALLIQQGVISTNQLDKDIDKDLLKRASKLMGEYNIPRLKESRIGRSKKALKEAINPEYDDGGYASFGIDISYEILDKNTQETIEQGEFYSSNEYILARTESELDIEYKMELRKAIGNNATYQNVLLSYQRPDRMSSYFLVEVDPEDYDLYFAEVEDNQEVSLTIRLTTFSHDEGMQIVGEDVTMDEIFMESQGKTNMRSKKALKEAINPEYDDGGYASFGIDISYEILDKNTQETIEQGEFYSSNEYILARTESELDIEYKMELRKAIGNNATYQNVLLSYQRPDRMSSYFLVEVDPEDYDLYFAEVEDNQEVSLTIRLTTFSHDEGMQIVGEDVTMDEIFMESQGKTNMRSKKALKESLITNGRKPISNLSINLFKEAQKKSRRKPIVEAGGDEIWNRVERAKEYLGGGDYLLDDFVKAMSNDAVEDILDYIERTNDIGYNEEQMESLVTERMKKVIKESKQPRHKSTMKESKKSRRKPIVEAGGDEIWNRVERAKEYLGGGDYLLDDFVKAMSNDAVEDILDYIERTNDIGYNEEQMESLVTERMKKVIKESKQPRHKSTMKESKKPLKESLCMPISGMEYMVYKKGVLGEGSGKVVVIGIATVNGENVTINGTKYNKSQYDFVGTKGY